MRETWQHRKAIGLCALLFNIFLSLTAIDAPAEDWKFSAKSDDGTMYYYDAARVTKVSEGVLRFWGKAVLSPKAVKKFVSIDGKFRGLDHVISLVEMDCAERKRRPLWIISSDKNGVVIENIELRNGESEWESVLPGSVQDDILGELCGKR